MDPDLVLAAGPRPRLHHQSARERFHEPEIGHRGAAPRPRRAVRVGVHARLRTPGGRRKAGRTGREGDVGFRHLARGELRRQRRIHRGVLREEHHAGGVAVEALMDAEVRERVPRALAAGEQALDQPDQVRTARIRRRHRGEAGRLVADQDVRVFVEHGEVLAHVAGRALCGRRRSQVGVRFPGAVDHHHVARLEQLRDVGARAVHAHLLGAHHLVEVRERHLREPAAEELVQPLPARVLRDRVLELHREGCVSWKRTTRQVPSACRASVRWASRCKSPPPCGRMSSL